MNFVEGATVGIDLGTTYSAISRIDDDGNPVVVDNSDGRSITPSVVLLGDEGNVMVGPSFERISIEDPRKVVEAIKRKMGDKDFHVVYQQKKLTPEFISALILKKLKQDAEKGIGAIGNAVITVPYYFNDVRRKATQDAGRIAGLNVIDIINEPTAAVLAYAWQRNELGRPGSMEKPRTVLVYDLGGGTFDVTVVRYDPTSFNVLATDGDVMLGGLDWSHRLVDHVAEQFQRKFGSDPRENPEALMDFNQVCEDAKRQLSDKTQVPISVYFEGKTLTVALTRKDFERMTADLMQRTRDTTELVMQQAGVTNDDLDEAILVGGSTHMPAVLEMIREITGREPSRDVKPEEAVAQGAAIHAAILQAREQGEASDMGQTLLKRLQAVDTNDVNSHSLGIKITDPDDRSRKKNHIMIPRNSTIPKNVSQGFVTTTENQKRVHVYVLEGEAGDPDACTSIGDFRVYDLPADLPKGTPVEVTYSYDSSGRINASAKVAGKSAATEIVRDSGLDDENVGSFEALAGGYTVE